MGMISDMARALDVAMKPYQDQFVDMESKLHEYELKIQSLSNKNNLLRRLLDDELAKNQPPADDKLNDTKPELR